jgi:hypothetical protein
LPEVQTLPGANHLCRKVLSLLFSYSCFWQLATCFWLVAALLMVYNFDIAAGFWLLASGQKLAAGC